MPDYFDATTLYAIKIFLMSFLAFAFIGMAYGVHFIWSEIKNPVMSRWERFVMGGIVLVWWITFAVIWFL